MIGNLVVGVFGALLAVWALAVAGWTVYHLAHLSRPRASTGTEDSGQTFGMRFLLLIPAKNEEAVLARALSSVSAVAYPRSHYRVVVIADQCTDGTAEAARSGGAECLERGDGPGGKGYAIAWALDRLPRDAYDAVVVLDADSIVHRGLLSAFARRLWQGQHALQADRRVLNAEQSVLTRLYTMAQQLRIHTFWAVKSDRGLSSIVFGSGFCLSRQVVTEVGWNAFGVAEDWEYSLHLVRAGYRVVIARETWVSCEEPHAFRQGYRQRVRWARGRYAVVARHGAQLLRDGLARRNAGLIDAGLTTLTPNTSLLLNLTLVGLALSWLGQTWWGSWSAVLFAAALAGQVAYAGVGLVRLRPSAASVAALAAAPVYLAWIGMIAIRSLVGVRSGGWLQVRRHDALRTAPTKLGT